MSEELGNRRARFAYLGDDRGPFNDGTLDEGLFFGENNENGTPNLHSHVGWGARVGRIGFGPDPWH